MFADDLVIDATHSLGSYHQVNLEEVLEFSRTWDPQYFHVDEELAVQSLFGGVVASGIHTMAIFQQLCVAAAYRHWAVIAGRSIDYVDLIAPVRPGDILTGSLTVSSVAPYRVDRANVTVHGSLSTRTRTSCFGSGC